MEHPEHLPPEAFIERCDIAGASVIFDGHRHAAHSRRWLSASHAVATGGDGRQWCTWITWTRLRTRSEAGEYLNALTRAIGRKSAA